MCVVKRAKFASGELGSILLRHQLKIYPDLASSQFRIHSVFKNFHSAEQIKKVADSYTGFSGYVWTGPCLETCRCRNDLVLRRAPYTAILRKVVRRNVHATITKGNMGYNQYTVPDTAAVEPTFFCFP